MNRNSLYGFEMREPDLRRSEDRKTYNVKSLWQRNHEIVNLAVRGFKQTEIAEILNISPQTVSNTLNSELGERKLAKLRKSRDEEASVVSEKIRVLTDKALKVYDDLFENEDGNTSKDLQKKAADTVVLELSGLRVPTRVQSQSFNTTATLAEIEEFKKRGIAAAKASGMIVEVEGESK